MVCIALLLLAAGTAAARPIVVGSKNFNESYVLGEVVAQALEAAGFAVERRFGLGGTLICFSALEAGEIDVYVEYTGTLAQGILGLGAEAADMAHLNGQIAARGLELLSPFGFDNTYALTMRRDRARALGIDSISDLAAHPSLRVVLSHEFIERDDGWPGLRAVYALPHTVRGIEHALAYQALEEDAIDVTDAYSTDGELERYGLTVLADDQQFFPEYLAAPLARASLPERARAALRRLGGSLDEASMQTMNAAVVFGGRNFAEVASEFLSAQGVAAGHAGDSFWQALARNVSRHLQLTAIALAAAVLLGIGVSLAVYRKQALARGVLYTCGLMQTVPSIALLALMIPVFGIGFLPAVVALFLYSLLPIVRNALTALTSVDPVLVRVAAAMGLSEREQLRHLFVPLALPAMFAGVRTAAVISIGTATLAAFIGAGGLGDPIVTGLSLNDASLILQGAVPAALLAILTEVGFELLEARLVPAHLREQR